MSEFEKTLDIIFGRWRSQILYTGVVLGIFDRIGSNIRNTNDIAKELGLDPKLTYRLLRALGSMGFLREESLSKESSGFSITAQGKLVSRDHPQTLRGIILLEEGQEHYAIWKHLPAMIRDGKQNAFLREYGHKIFEYRDLNPDYAEVFDHAMMSYSATQTALVLEALDGYDFSNFFHICDIGGGTGHLLANILVKYPHMHGTVLELDAVTSKKDLLLAPRLGVNERCSYMSGDMFSIVPSADAYIMKMILHDWNDDECVRILSNVYKASPDGARLFIAEHLIPDPEEPHFSKLFDIHMMCVASGKERTIDEYLTLLERSGWRHNQTLYPSHQTGLIGVIECIKKPF